MHGQVHILERGVMHMTFNELKQKDVVPVFDGKRMGKPIDLGLNPGACVEALVVPARSGSFLNLLKQDKEGCFIPWNQVLRIGNDVILVEVHDSSLSNTKDE